MGKNLLKLLLICNNDSFNTDIVVQQFISKNLNREQYLEIIDFNFYPYESLKKHNAEEQEICKKIPHIDKLKCKYCGKCVDYCKIGGITFDRQIPLVVFDKINCISCFACIKACNIAAIKQKDYQIGIILKQNIDKKLFIKSFYYKTFPLYAKHLILDFKKNESDSYQIGIINSENYLQIKNLEAEQIIEISNIDKIELAISDLLHYDKN